MSLLEDVFLQDEAGEAQELERIIEGDEYDERPRSRASSPDSNDNSDKEDEAEEDKRHVGPTSGKPKRIVKNPRVILNPARLTGPRGIQVIPEHFKDFKFKGKGHEKEDLDLVLKKLEHWAYRLFPKFEFKDCLKKIETLGNKRPVMVHLTKIRTDQFMSDETVVQQDSSDDEAPQPVQEEDEFDKLLQQQIVLARATPAPVSTRKPAFSTPMDKSITMPKAISSPSINDEQRERMLRNRQLAGERRVARLTLNTSESNARASENPKENVPTHYTSDNVTCNESLNLKDTHTVRENYITDQMIDGEEEHSVIKAKNNKLNVNDSSDEDDGLVINESVTVDVHDSHRHHDSNEELSDTGYQNKSNLNEEKGRIRADNDIEMNETEPRRNDIDVNEETGNPTNIDIHSDISNGNVEENSNKMRSKVVEPNDVNKHSEILSENITVNDCYQVEDKTEQGVEETVMEEKSIENELQEVMDVDFSDDF